jgi:malate dehydrogenase (oxaloacetate-decarboxylating)
LVSEDDVLNLHRILHGKIQIQNRIPLDEINNEEEKESVLGETLSLIYTPGVAHVAEKIQKNKGLVYDYTSKWNTIAIICDGTRVLGLGNIGPEAALPVMEGKSVIFRTMGGVNAIPLCIDSQDQDEIIKFVKILQPAFGAINIEDIESPKVLYIVDKLQKELSIPIFHDDQHGTSIVTLAALFNALKLINKNEIDDLRIVIAGAGSAGYGIFKILQKANCSNIIVVDKKGAIYRGRREGGIDNPYKKEIAANTNPEMKAGNLGDVIRESDVFIGVSGKAGLLTKQMVQSMKKESIVFALSNPDPEILPSDAAKAGAKITATGRSDYPNQINNALVFPYILRALLDTRSKKVDYTMLVSIANAIASLVDQSQLKEDYILPKLNDLRLTSRITKTLQSN